MKYTFENKNALLSTDFPAFLNIRLNALTLCSWANRGISQYQHLLIFEY